MNARPGAPCPEAPRGRANGGLVPSPAAVAVRPAAEQLSSLVAGSAVALFFPSSARILKWRLSISSGVRTRHLSHRPTGHRLHQAPAPAWLWLGASADLPRRANSLAQLQESRLPVNILPRHTPTGINGPDDGDGCKWAAAAFLKDVDGSPAPQESLLGQERPTAAPWALRHHTGDTLLQVRFASEAARWNFSSLSVPVFILSTCS